MARILVADQADIAAALAAAGHDVVSHDADLAVVSDLASLAELRGIPVIVLTTPANVIAAFAAGADDVVRTPVSVPEVVARAGAILRRSPHTPPVLRYADVVLDEARYEVYRADVRIELTATEFNLLRYFLQHPRRVVSKRQILQHVWSDNAERESNIVETYVAYLRRKLGPELIKTVRQVGYMLD
jgi:two-component system OmpR family response regulator